MSDRLKTSDLNEWYRKLNVARTQSGIGLSGVGVPAIGSSTVTPINQLVTDIRNTRNANKFLQMSDDSTIAFTKGDIIKNKHTIDNTITSLLRVCANVSCQTTLITEVKNTNGADQNGTKSNGNSTCSDWYMCAHNGSGFGGLSDKGWAGSAAYWVGVWGTSSYTYWEGVHSNGAYEYGGNNNSYYDPATETYSAKNHYPVAQANNR